MIYVSIDVSGDMLVVNGQNELAKALTLCKDLKTLELECEIYPEGKPAIMSFDKLKHKLIVTDVKPHMWLYQGKLFSTREKANDFSLACMHRDVWEGNASHPDSNFLIQRVPISDEKVIDTTIYTFNFMLKKLVKSLKVKFVSVEPSEKIKHDATALEEGAFFSNDVEIITTDINAYGLFIDYWNKVLNILDSKGLVPKLVGDKVELVSW